MRYPVDLRVAVDVLRFEATERGEAVLKVRWALLNPYTGEPLLVRENGYRAEVAGPEPAAAVQAMSRALGEFSQDVADALRGRRKPRPPASDLGLTI